MIAQFPYRDTNIFRNVKKYVDLYSEQGWVVAGVFYNTLNLPEQLKDQFKLEVQKEFYNRGITVNVK